MGPVIEGCDRDGKGERIREVGETEGGKVLERQ